MRESEPLDDPLSESLQMAPVSGNVQTSVTTCVSRTFSLLDLKGACSKIVFAVAPIAVKIRYNAHMRSHEADGRGPLGWTEFQSLAVHK